MLQTQNRNILSLLTATFVVAIASPSLAQVNQNSSDANVILLSDTVVTAVDWNPAIGNVGTGDICGSVVSITPVDNGENTGNFSGSAYSAAPLSTTQGRVGHAAADEWTATFDPPVSDLLLYTYFWRGPSVGGPDPTTYTFDQPFTILSGLPGVTTSGNTIFAPQNQFHSGIIKFTGPVSSLSLTTSATSTGAGQGLTFGVVVPNSDTNGDGVPDDCEPFTVTTLADGPVAAAGDLPGSLRQAIFDANARQG